MKLQADIETIRNAGYGVAAISYDSPEVLRDFATRQQIGFPLLADHDSAVIRRYGVADRRYRPGHQIDVKTETVHANSVGFTPVDGIAYPSAFLVGPDGKVIWRYVSESAELRLTGAAIINQAVGILQPKATNEITAGKLDVVTDSSDNSVGLGSRILLEVDLKLPAGIHVYGPEVAEEYRGLSWNMDDSKNCWSASEVTFPRPVSKMFEFASTALPIYESEVRLHRELIISPAISARDASIFDAFKTTCLDRRGEINVSGELNIQACSDKECYPPQSVPVTWRFQFKPPDLTRSPEDLRREFESSGPVAEATPANESCLTCVL